MTKTLHLIIPGLLGPWTLQPEFPLPQTTALERLLGRATVQSAATGLEATLFTLFGLAPDSDANDLPVAAVTRLADGGAANRGWWLRADPVHLQADLHQILLLDARILNIDAGEAQTLLNEFNRVFAADGWNLEIPHPSRWYLRLDQHPDIRTYPLMAAIGHNINPLLPFGGASPRWHTLLTEIQMLFHSSPVKSTTREAGTSAYQQRLVLGRRPAA